MKMYLKIKNENFHQNQIIAVCSSITSIQHPLLLWFFLMNTEIIAPKGDVLFS